MPLQAKEPTLDSRNYAQLKDEALRHLHRFVPEWTDHNESDPGIALVELFAWFTEQMLFALNRTPELNTLKFLQLLGMELAPARPATAHLTFTAREGVVQATVPLHTRIEADIQSELPVIFETEQAVDLVVPPLAKVQVYDGGGFNVVTPYNEPNTPAFQPFGWSAQLNSALYLGFAPSQNESDRFPPQMRFRVFLPEQVGRLTFRADEIPISPVQVVWEARNKESRRWRELELILDETAGFTHEGYVVVSGPSHPLATPEGKGDAPLYWVRCRLVGGNYPHAAAEIAFIRPNTVPALSLETVENEILGESDGRPGQVFRLRRRPVWVTAGTTSPAGENGEPALPHVVTLDESDQETVWKRVDDLYNPLDGEPEREYRLNATTGEIIFGDGRYGQIPPAGVAIVARTYRYGGGSIANAAAGTITGLMDNLPGVDAVTNERKAEGGSDEQSVEDLRQQAPSRLRHRGRAVTVEDYKELACEVGGVIRAHALDEWHPDFRHELRVPGAVTVVIVPDTSTVPPEPSRELLRAVAGFLDERRLITTELFVTGPRYRPVRLEIQVVINPLAAPNQVQQAIVRALSESKYLDPRQQVFGVPFYPTNLYNAILGVPDVRAVRAFSIFVDHTPHEPVTSPIDLAEDEMLYLEEYLITVELDV